MSSLGSISGHLEREQQLLRELNTALIALEADALGRTSDFGLSDEDVLRSRQTLLGFTVRLRSALDQKSTSVDLQPLVHRLKSGMKPLEDWQEDFGRLVKELQSRDHLEDEVLPILEDVLSLLDSEFTEDLRRLYAR
jgi:hypothetical protein